MYNISEEKINELKSMVYEMEQKDFPEFDVDKKVDLFDIFPFYYESKYERYEDYIKVSDIVGDNWAFDNVEDRGNYPRCMKLNSILDYYKGIKHRGQDLPPVDIIKVNNVYHLSEGNHRLYVLKWLENLGLIKDPVIRADIREYDYGEFLNRICLIDSYTSGESTKYIDFGFMEPIDNETYNRLLELKSDIPVRTYNR